MRYYILVKCSKCNEFVALEEVPEPVYAKYAHPELQYPYTLTHMSIPELHSYFLPGDDVFDPTTVSVKGTMPYTCAGCWANTNTILKRTGYYEENTITQRSPV